MNDWTKTGWPDWPDEGKRVEVEFDNGMMVQGTLDIDDVFFTGEDEVPVFFVITDDGKKQSFADANRWRFL